MKLVVDLADSGLELALILTPIQQTSVCGYVPKGGIPRTDESRRREA